jgi:putative ABC transport system ATP-binding protein
MTLLQDINASGTTIIMVTHDNEQAQLAQRIVQIKDGVLSEESPILTQAIA